MTRYFNNREVELLAPVGTFKDFKDIINSGADAVYFGGKDFNMRMHRKDHNLNEEEIKEAISIAHSLGKKVYVTFNNMMSDEELNKASSFLLFLEEVQPDALIIQDMGALKLIKDLGLTIPIHASVMANVHNKNIIDRLSELGVTRVVTSREMSLSTIKELAKDTSMEFEYFVHGDMCAVHGAQCLYSGMLFGKSSNRGLCMKPCRWAFKTEVNGNIKSEENYPLAVKDMSMYRHLPELIDAGVCSFKIEGRMRGSEYLRELIDMYSNAIDRYIEDPVGYYIDHNHKKLQENRVRNLSTAYAFKTPGKSNIDIDGTREPRIFSRAVEEFSIDNNRVQYIKEYMKLTKKSKTNLPSLAVKVNNMDGLKTAVDNGADMIYLSGDVFAPDRPFSREDVKFAVQYAKGKNVYISLPRMMNERQFKEYSYLLDYYKSVGIKGFVIGNLGAIKELSNYDLDIIGDYSLNVYNNKTVEFYKEEGLNWVTLSIELPLSVLNSILQKQNEPCEVIVQGAPTIMYMEHCIYGANHDKTSKDWCESYCNIEKVNLIDEKGIAHPVYADQYCRNHIITSKDLCLLPILEELCKSNVNSIRIEGQHYTPEVLGEVVSLYRTAIDKFNLTIEGDTKAQNTLKVDEISQLETLTKRAQGLGALNFD